MKITLTKDSKVHLSEQISQAIADRIKSGLLSEGEKLPSVRGLSEQLGVSLVTVQKAYTILEKKKLIERKQGTGSFVRLQGTSKEIKQTDWQNLITDYLPRAQTWKEMSAIGTDIPYNLSMANLSPELLPIKPLMEISTRTINEDPKILTSYSAGTGDNYLRKILSEYFTHKGLPAADGNIVITNGSQQGIEIIAKTFLGEGDVVLTETPTYIGILDIFRSRGVTIKTVPADEEGDNLNTIIKMCEQFRPKIMYTTPCFQNPTGYFWSEKKRRLMLELARNFNMIIIEDDVWSELNFEKNDVPPLKKWDTDGHVIYVKSFSKFVSPALRIGCVVADGKILRKLKAAKIVSDLGSPLLTQRILAKFLEEFAVEKHVRNVNKSLRIRRDLLFKALQSLNHPGLRWTTPKGGPVLWITLPEHLNSDQLLMETLKSQLLFLPSSVCYPNEPETNHLRICYGNLELAEYTKAVEIFATNLHDFLQNDKMEYTSQPIF